MEGATRLFPPATNLGQAAVAPGRREKGQPFYNPGMALNRDLSILLVEAHARSKGREIDVCDALAGTGARSVRIAHEVPVPLIVHANDADANAVAALQRAADGNGVASRLRVHHGDAHALLTSQRFDVVDLDPCGSPMPFLDAAVRATRHGGLLCATATDTGALAGSFPRVCRRRYDAHHGLHRPRWRSEVGLRILAGAVVRSAARFDRVAIPVLSVTSGHWMRVVCRVEDGRRDADEGLRGLSAAVEDPETGTGRFVPLAPTPTAPWAGPLWTGPLHDAGLVAGMRAARDGKALARPREVDLLLGRLHDESLPGCPPFWIVPDLLAARLGPPPRRDVLMATLRDAGHEARRSHLDPQGIRTGADLLSLAKAWPRTAKP